MDIRRVDQSDGLRSCILVLGADSASRTVMTGLLAALGCEFPASLVGGKPGRISPRISAFNDELLLSAGSSPEEFTSFHRDWMESPYAPDFLDRAVVLLHEEFGSAPLCVLSDPAISRLVPFWRAALDRLGCAAHAAIVIGGQAHRGPSDQNEPLAEMIALRHILDSERDTRDMPRVYVGFEQLMQEWAAVAGKASQAFELTWPKPLDVAEFEVADLLDEYRAEGTPSAGRGAGNSWLSETQAVLFDWAQNGETADGQVVLDRIRSEFDLASKAFARVVRAAGPRLNQAATRSRVNGLRPAPPRTGGNASDELEAVKAALLEQRRSATLLNAEIEQQIQAREAVEAQLLEAQAEIAASRSRRKEMARVIENREAKIARINEELAARYEELARLQRLMVRSNPFWAAKAAVRRVNRAVRRPS